MIVVLKSHYCNMLIYFLVRSFFLGGGVKIRNITSEKFITRPLQASSFPELQTPFGSQVAKTTFVSKTPEHIISHMFPICVEHLVSFSWFAEKLESQHEPFPENKNYPCSCKLPDNYNQKI